MDNRLQRSLRAIGHNLKPVVTVGERGVSEGVIEELERALNDHELIKVKFPGEDREARRALIGIAVEATGAELVQTIGRIALLYRPGADGRPALSNLTRGGI